MHYAQNKRGTKQGQNYTRICSSNGLYFEVAPPPMLLKHCTPLGGFPIRQWDRLQGTRSCWNRRVFPRRLQQIWKNLEFGFSCIQLLKSQSFPLANQSQFQNIKDEQLPVDAPCFTATRATGSSGMEETFRKHTWKEDITWDELHFLFMVMAYVNKNRNWPKL